MQNDQRIARQVQGLYRYKVGQKAGIGLLVAIVGGLAGAMFFLASAADAFHAIASHLLSH